jgi:hypothetical protein
MISGGRIPVAVLTGLALQIGCAEHWMAHLWDTGAGRVSLQVLQEYYVAVTRKLEPGLTKEEAREDVVALGTWAASWSAIRSGPRPAESRCAASAYPLAFPISSVRRGTISNASPTIP